MSDPWADALPVFNRVLGVAIHYSGEGIPSKALRAPKIDEAADPYQGLTGKARRIGFEIQQIDLPREPEKSDLITEDAAGTVWGVIDIADRDDVAAWIVIVEEEVAGEDGE